MKMEESLNRLPPGSCYRMPVSDLSKGDHDGTLAQTVMLTNCKSKAFYTGI